MVITLSDQQTLLRKLLQANVAKRITIYYYIEVPITINKPIEQKINQSKEKTTFYSIEKLYKSVNQLSNQNIKQSIKQMIGQSTENIAFIEKIT